jgi:hypothetical protein
MSVGEQDLITVKGDHIAAFQNLFIQAYGVPDPKLGSIGVTPVRAIAGPNRGQLVGNQRTLLYGADQCGVELSVMADDKETQVVVMPAPKR